MECCFSVVCKDCLGVTGGGTLSAAVSKAASESNQSDTEAAPNNDSKNYAATKKSAKTCLACLEPI